jgi:hypothetical protein
MLAGAIGSVAAHDIDEAGTPVCIEANYMMADAMNAPFGVQGPGRVIEMNIFTGTPGITVGNPFNGGNAHTDICPDGVVCPAAWKPTGVLSGGENGHAFITSAGQVALTQFHRDGNPIRTVSYKALLGNPTTGGPPMPNFSGGVGFASVPRPLGTQLMPNGNLIQAICDANFFNAFNSDDDGAGGLEANHYFPPVNSTDARASNSRLLVIDQATMEVIDEYSRPKKDEPGHDLWGCAAGIMFDDTGMWISTFHGAAVLRIDWKAGMTEGRSSGIGSNSACHSNKHGKENCFKLGDGENRAVVTEVVDFRLGEDADSPWRRDSLRAISFDESGNIYATDRERSAKCERDDACGPLVFRQRVNIASMGLDEDNPGSGYNDASLRRSVALDPGVNVIAGIRTNRMSGPGCDYVTDPSNAGFYATDVAPLGDGYALEEDLCDVETVLVASSAFNPGDILNDGGCTGAHASGNKCFKPGGGVGEYIIHPNFTDGAQGPCNGDPNDPSGNTGCAQPIATFTYTAPNGGSAEPVDPRMLMVIHEAFGQ